MRLKKGADLRDISDMCIKVGTDLRAVDMIVGKFGTDLRVIWRRNTDSGWVFTQGHPISVSGRFIRLLGQK